MIIEFEGRQWQYDEDAVTVQQAIAMHLAHGLTIKAWQQAIPELDPRAVQCCYWLMLAQNGEKRVLKDCEFPAVEFMAAYMAGLRATAGEDEEEPEPDPTPPSPPDDPPSPGPSSPEGYDAATAARDRGGHRVLTTPIGRLRAEYLFHLHRLCGLDSGGIGALTLMDFANLTDSIDEWLKQEARLAGPRMT